MTPKGSHLYSTQREKQYTTPQGSYIIGKHKFYKYLTPCGVGQIIK